MQSALVDMSLGLGMPVTKAVTSSGFEGLWSEILAKRLLTCLATLLMPDEAVDENLESTLERLQYYLEASTLALMPVAQPIETFPAKLGDPKPSPELIVVDE